MDRPMQSRTDQRLLESLPGKIANSVSEEPTLINLYRNITKENESQARNVLMFVVRDDKDTVSVTRSTS